MILGTKECNINSTKDKSDKDFRRSSSKRRQRRNSLGVCETPQRKKSDSESVASLKLEDNNPIWQQASPNSQRVVLTTQMSNMSISAASATSTSSNHSRSSTPIEVCYCLLIANKKLESNLYHCLQCSIYHLIYFFPVTFVRSTE